MGAIDLKKKGNFQGDDGPTLKPGETYKNSLVTPSGDVCYHTYSSLSFPPKIPPLKPRFTIIGIRKPGGGYGKAIKPALTPKDKEQPESSQRHIKVRRHILPPTIKRPPRQFESSDEE